MIQAVTYNLVTGAIQEELPFTALSFSSRLNDTGQWSMTLPLSFEVEGYEKMQAASFDLNQSCLVVLRDGQPVFAGLIHSEQAEVGETESLKIGGPDAVWGFLDRRVLNQNYSVTNRDQFLIASDLIGQASDHGIGIEALYDSLSGIGRDRTWWRSDGQNLGKLLRDLTGLEKGFDMLPEVSGNQQLGFQLGMRMGYPKLRRDTGFVLGLNKNMSLINYSRDGSKVANRVFELGSGADVDRVWAIGTWDAKLLSYPRYDATETKSSVLQFGTLAEYAIKHLLLYAEPQEFITVQVNPDDPDSAMGSFRCGDTFRVIAKRGRIDVDGLYRVNSYQYSVDADGAEKLQLTLTGAEVTS